MVDKNREIDQFDEKLLRCDDSVQPQVELIFVG